MAIVRQTIHLYCCPIFPSHLFELAGVIKAQFNVSMAQRNVGAVVLHRLGFRRLSVRSLHSKQDVEAQEAHKNTLPGW